MTRPVATTMDGVEEDALTPEQAWRDLINKDDRNSPEEYPEMALITFDELAGYMDRATRPPAGPEVEEAEESEFIDRHVPQWLTPRGTKKVFVTPSAPSPDREEEIRRLGCMCRNVEIGSHAVSVGLSLPPHMQDYSESRAEAGLSPEIAVDACLVGEIKDLWSKGIRTYGSCCGHNKVRGMINVHQNDAEAMRAMGYEQWPISEGKWEWTFYPRSVEAIPLLYDRIREDERDRLYANLAGDGFASASARASFRANGAMLPADRARLRGASS